MDGWMDGPCGSCFVLLLLAGQVVVGPFLSVVRNAADTSSHQQ